MLGPDLRRGVSDLDGTGEAVSGIVVMRQGENALDVIDRVKAKLKEIEPGLPPGVKVVPIYDRSELIRARDRQRESETLIEVILTVVLIILLFLWHVPSAVIPLVTIPVAVLLVLHPVPRCWASPPTSCRSAASPSPWASWWTPRSSSSSRPTRSSRICGRAAAASGDYEAVIVEAVKEVAPASFFALLVIAVSFLPVLTLEAQEGGSSSRSPTRRTWP